ncbi:MAG TPA: hypothetical protein PKC29_15630 [Thermodesulfobacteriota bacterium]|nr:hypothetical protein [Thermodesulfobacteriota bacterium]
MAGYSDEQMRQGYGQAESFIARIKSGEPIMMDALAQQFELARMGSMARARGFAARLQAVLMEAGHATS